MYPFLHLLKDGTVFVFTDKASQIFNVEAGRVVRSMPDLPGMHRTYPNTGGSVMLPLTKENEWDAVIMICGGGAEDSPTTPSDNTCGTIRPMSPDPKWEMTQMPGGGRIMVEGVLLLDETVLWINGARTGCQGFGTASQPAYEAMIFDPRAKKWSTAGKSHIARMYHSVALMLLDGTVLVAGSNPNEMPLLEEQVEPSDPARAFPTEFRVEKYIPPYLIGDNAKRRPSYVKPTETTFVIGKTVSTVSFKLARPAKQVKTFLYHGGFVTHALHMGQVMVEMEDLGLRHISGDRYEKRIKVPGIKLAPGPYVLYVVADGIPSVGQFVSVQAA